MSFELSESGQAALLGIARGAITSPAAPEPRLEGELARPSGAFVTLHKRGRLRGCIGRMTSQEPLATVVMKMARAAAYEDPRFPSLAPEEFADIDIEISVLSPMERCAPEDVVPGLHGVMLALGGRAGVFLPQVATEQGWSREELLDELCGKAGLPPGSYKAPGAALSRFTAFVFGER